MYRGFLTDYFLAETPLKSLTHRHCSMSQNHYHFDVVMSCEGCSNAINRVLTKLKPDVSEIKISLENQTVDVYTTLPYETIYDKISKTGKEIKSGKAV